MHKNKLLLILLIFLMSKLSIAQDVCDFKKAKKQNDDVADILCDPDFGVIFLKYSPKYRRIWLINKKYGFVKLIKSIEKNANPELVGSKDEIRFITRRVVNMDGRKFIGFTIAERSMRGDGGGQCGAGVEVFFVAAEIGKFSIVENGRFKIASCIYPIDLKSDEPNTSPAIEYDNKNYVIFRWLTYLEYEKTVTGYYDFLTNNLTIKENTQSYHWDE